MELLCGVWQNACIHASLLNSSNPLSENHTDQTLISQPRLGEGGRNKSGCRSWWMIVCGCYGYSCIPNTCRRDWEGSVLAKRKCVFSLKLHLFFMKAQQHLVIWVLLAFKKPESYRFAPKQVPVNFQLVKYLWSSRAWKGIQRHWRGLDVCWVWLSEGSSGEQLEQGKWCLEWEYLGQPPPELQDTWDAALVWFNFFQFGDFHSGLTQL